MVLLGTPTENVKMCSRWREFHPLRSGAFHGSLSRQLRGFGCRKPQSYVVGHPGSIRITELGFQDHPHLVQIVAASFVGEALKKIQGESFQVTDDVARQGGWTRD